MCLGADSKVFQTFEEKLMNNLHQTGIGPRGGVWPRLTAFRDDIPK